MKKIFYIIVAIAFAFGFTSCVVKDNPINKNEGVIMEAFIYNGWHIIINSKNGVNLIDAIDKFKGPQTGTVSGENCLTIRGNGNISLEEFQYIQEKMPRLETLIFDGYSGKIPGGAFYGNKKIKKVEFLESSKPYIIESGKNIMPAFGNGNYNLKVKIYNAEVRTDFSKVFGRGNMLSGDWVISERTGTCTIYGKNCHKYYNKEQMEIAIKGVGFRD